MAEVGPILGRGIALAAIGGERGVFGAGEQFGGDVRLGTDRQADGTAARLDQHGIEFDRVHDAAGRSADMVELFGAGAVLA